ncbi:amidoligase family protein [Sulfurospirillum sp. T05]|uniref:Amidoligase family protein n=1 Tax=Sulfurospirillum tamanense TaxID=2813362 RepID=A0ABS2WU76_9BACT|nr:amidoligase family protein [Sulfurospirillum tamanensis]MBN2965206.1 amidoligase family protein [Sulfurospirillum tamanensis]
MAFTPLACPLTHEGKPRRAGFELEFAGLNPEDAAHIVANVYGGTVEKQSRFSFTCKGTVGVFDVVLDAQVLTTLKHRKLLKEVGIDLEKIDQEEVVERAIEKGASMFVPCEITTPPLVEKAFGTLEELAKALVKRGAKGTTHTLHYAFGLHINLEVPDVEVKTLLAYLRAFFVLEPYLQEISHIDLARRLSKFIDPFPEVYVQKVLHPSYAPASVGVLMRDYFAYNPTRNRSLDMTPLFGTIDKALTQHSLQEPELLKPRPALHYRLPNCSLGEQGWSIAVEWNRFMLVEALAHDAESLQALLAKFQEIESAYVFGKKNKYKEEVKKWVASLASA